LNENRTAVTLATIDALLPLLSLLLLVRQAAQRSLYYSRTSSGCTIVVSVSVSCLLVSFRLLVLSGNI